MFYTHTAGQKEGDLKLEAFLGSTSLAITNTFSKFYCNKLIYKITYFVYIVHYKRQQK